MSNLIIKNGTISSRDLAIFAGKNHFDLMRDIRNMENDWTKLGQSNFTLSSYLNSQNKKQPEYQLSKTESLYIASKFNNEIRAKLVLRWEELEKQLSKPKDRLENTKKHLRRFETNKQNIPDGYFSMIEQAIYLVIFPLELKEKDLIDKCLPDGSLGIGFCRFLRDENGFDTKNLPTYPHRFEDGRVVNAKLYPDTILHLFKKYIKTWVDGNGDKYFKERTNNLRLDK